MLCWWITWTPRHFDGIDPLPIVGKSGDICALHRAVTVGCLVDVVGGDDFKVEKDGGRTEGEEKEEKT